MYSEEEERAYEALHAAELSATAIKPEAFSETLRDASRIQAGDELDEHSGPPPPHIVSAPVSE